MTIGGPFDAQSPLLSKVVDQPRNEFLAACLQQEAHRAITNAQKALDAWDSYAPRRRSQIDHEGANVAAALRLLLSINSSPGPKISEPERGNALCGDSERTEPFAAQLAARRRFVVSVLAVCEDDEGSNRLNRIYRLAAQESHSLFSTERSA